MFSNINKLPLWHDEASTVVLSTNTLKYGYPRVWDGRNIALHSIAEYTSGYAFSNNTWLHYYICAASIALFGQSNLSVRLPFVLFGIATVFIVWKISFFLFKRNRIADLTAALLTVYVPFLLYAKQARYYSISMFLIAVSAYLYLMVNDNQPKRNRKVTWLIISLLFLFLTNIVAFATMIGALCLHIIFQRKLLNVKIFILMIFAGVFIIVSLWFLPEQFSISRYIPARLLVVFWKIQVYFVPILSLGIVLSIISMVHYFITKEQFTLFTSYDLFFPLLILSNMTLVIIPEQNILNHYFLGVVVAVPFVMTSVILYSKRISRTIAAILLLLTVGSNVLNVVPYYLIRTNEFEPNKATQFNTVGSPPHLTPYNFYDRLYDVPGNKLYPELPGPILHGIISSPYTMADCLILPLNQYCNEKLSFESHLIKYMKEITGEYINAPMEITKLLQKYGNTSEKIYINTIEYEYILLNTDMQVVNRFQFDQDSILAKLTIVSDDEIDWFIVTDEKYVSGLHDPEYLIKNRTLFTQYKISTKDILNTPDLDLHQFETTYEGKDLIILHRN
jgi:hypothetical protein